MREVGQTPLLTPEQETALAERVNAGDLEARELMVRANLRLVVKIAREYEGLGLPLPDLISEGNIGLVKAVDRFDPRRGAKLSSYSALWIRQQIRRALSNQSRTIRLPVHTLGQIQQLRRSAADLKDRLGREATHEELSRVMGLPSRRVATLREAGLPAASLEAPLSSEIPTSLSDVVADEGAANPAEAAEQNDAIRLLRQLVPKLSQREAAILRARFGLDTGEESTLDAIGAKLGVTRERIRQLQQIALQHLREMLEEGGSAAVSS